jgi:hypothetical protein
MSETAFCYHCGTHHPIEEMRQILTKNGKRWRCVKSIEATKIGITKRDAFGQGITAINKARSASQNTQDGESGTKSAFVNTSSNLALPETTHPAHVGASSAD